MMSNNSLSIKAKIQVAKPAADVFEAIVNPEKMCNYFLAQGSQKMAANTTVTWKFPEFDEDVPVKVLLTGLTTVPKKTAWSKFL
jgi:uncharacterized protein YndB with AHSA1/START domain